ncbi:MAG: nitroreductase family protein [Alphaproteobacteria bacterium]
MTDQPFKTLADIIAHRYGEGQVGGGEAGRDLSADDVLARILLRRTHRRYTPDPIPDDLLDVLFAAAFSASAKSDLQQGSVVVVKDARKRKALADLIPSMPWIGTAPVFMVWIGDSRRIRRICELRGKPFGNDHLDAFLNAAVDAALAMQTFILAAEAKGLGCCPISVVRNHVEAVAEILELPLYTFPVAGLCVGWPSQEGFVSMRLPPKANVHVDRYDDWDLAEEVAGYDARRDARFSIPAASRRMNDVYGEAPFYGWSEDKARQVSTPERDRLGRFVRAQGIRTD